MDWSSGGISAEAIRHDFMEFLAAGRTLSSMGAHSFRASDFCTAEAALEFDMTSHNAVLRRAESDPNLDGSLSSTTTMGKQPVAESSSESDSDSGSASPPPKRPSHVHRQTPLPSVDFSASTPRASRKSKPSQRQQEIEDNTSAAKDAKLAALEKRLATEKKKHERTKSALRERDVERAPPESEEEDEVDMSSFSASFRSRGIVSTTAPKTAPKKLRKSGETPVMTPMSRSTLQRSLLPDCPNKISVPLADIGDGSNFVSGSDDARTDGADENGDAPPRPGAQKKRGRSQSPVPAKKSKKRKNAIEPLAQAEFVSGKPRGGSRTNLKDYTEPASKLIRRAMHKYEVRVWTRQPYPPSEIQIQTAKEIWDEVCTEAEERMELTHRMLGMITKYGPHGRSSMKDCVRPLVGPTYSFQVGNSNKIIRKNTKIYKMLLEESAFHYKDPKERTGYLKNKIIIDSIKAIWFRNKSSRGVLFVEYFSPISLVTLALVLTAIEFCIEEYSTGRFQQGVFDELVNKDRYETHLKDLTDWVALKPDVTAVVLQRMHDTCRTATGAALVKTTGRMTEVARTKALAELEAMNVDGSDSNNSDDE
ncbi:hypothetical protein MVEN_00011300 [Mycena venus]|uniref:DUF6532 domain-containing protein n=1 Tax=Mycena venus TaxID=2733690 RepID=A0A8H7DHG7_9AGAR|nr:hypothetical protein MVEN_00011300 [Mycena venus]